MCRIAHVGSCLVVDANSIKDDERSMDQERDQRVEDGGDEHDPFAKKDED